MSTYAEEATYFFSFVLAVVTVILVMLCSFRSGIKTMAKRGVFTILILAILTATVSYSTLARLRSNIQVERCKRELSPDKQYMARICYTRRYDILQLLTNDESRLLAERTFDDYGEPVKIYWESKELQYLTANGEGGTVSLETVRLPPTWYDRLLARLP